MRVILIIAICLSFSTWGQGDDWKQIILDTQADTNKNIQELLFRMGDSHDRYKLNEAIDAIKHRTHSQGFFEGLYEQFIHYRHSSPELNLAIFEHQLRVLHYVLTLHLYPSLAVPVRGEYDIYFQELELPTLDMAKARIHSLLNFDRNKTFPEEKFPEHLFPKPSKSIEFTDKTLEAFCHLNYPTSRGTCKSFDKLIKNTKITQLLDGPMFTRPDDLRILSEQKLQKPLSEITSILLDLIEKAKNGEKVEGYLNEIFLRVFKQNGFTDLKADEYVTKILGLYGQRGASWSISFAHMVYDYFKQKKKMPHRLFMSSLELSIIFSSISVLDKYTWRDQKRHFSIPRNIKSPYLVGKPYYFWMSYLLAKEFKPNSIHSTKSIVRGVQLLNQAYQLEAEYNGRNPFSFYHSEKLSPSNNLKRIDIVNTLSGAVHARHSNQMIDLGLPFKKMLDQSEMRHRDYYIGLVDHLSGEKVSDKTFFRHRFNLKSIIDSQRVLYVDDINGKGDYRVINIVTGDQKRLKIPKKIEGMETNRPHGSVGGRYIFFEAWGNETTNSFYYYDLETDRIRRFYTGEDEYLSYHQRNQPVIIKRKSNTAKVFSPYSENPQIVELVAHENNYDENHNINFKSDSPDPHVLRMNGNEIIVIQNLKTNEITEIKLEVLNREKSWRSVQVSPQNNISYIEYFPKTEKDGSKWIMKYKQYKNAKLVRSLEAQVPKSKGFKTGDAKDYFPGEMTLIDQSQVLFIHTYGFSDEKFLFWNLNTQKFEKHYQIQYSFFDKFLNKAASVLLGQKYTLKSFVSPFVFNMGDRYLSHNAYLENLDLIDIPPSIFRNLNNDWRNLLRPSIGIKNMLKQLKTSCNSLFKF